MAGLVTGEGPSTSHLPGWSHACPPSPSTFDPGRRMPRTDCQGAAGEPRPAGISSWLPLARALPCRAAAGQRPRVVQITPQPDGAGHNSGRAGRMKDGVLGTSSSHVACLPPCLCRPSPTNTACPSGRPVPAPYSARPPLCSYILVLILSGLALRHVRQSTDTSHPTRLLHNATTTPPASPRHGAE